MARTRRYIQSNDYLHKIDRIYAEHDTFNRYINNSRC